MISDGKEYYIKLANQTFRAIVSDDYTRDGKLFCKKIKIGGELSDCVNISVLYSIDGQVDVAKILFIQSEPECGLFKALGDGQSVDMIKAAIQFTTWLVPDATIFEFDDMSRIDCLKEAQKGAPGKRPMLRPIPLSLFYIALHGKTWYEAKFGAKMLNRKSYDDYRTNIKALYDPKVKNAYSWDELRRTTQSVPEYNDMLEEIYNSSRTLNDFFNNVPQSQRCLVLGRWLEQFMKYFLKGTFSADNWYININGFTQVPITISETPYMSGGGSSKGAKGTRRIRKNKNKTRRDKLYYRIIDNKSYF